VFVVCVDLCVALPPHTHACTHTHTHTHSGGYGALSCAMHIMLFYFFIFLFLFFTHTQVAMARFPVPCISCFFITFLLATTYAIRLLEGPANPSHLYSVWNPIWMVIVTMTTTGERCRVQVQVKGLGLGLGFWFRGYVDGHCHNDNHW